MPGRGEFSKTMRIDLIPEVPSEPVSGRKKRVVIARPAAAEGLQEGGRDDSRYEELLQSIYDAALITDLAGRVVNVNVRALEFFHYSREEFRELTAFDLVSGADPSLIQTLLENLEHERFTLIQAYCVRKDGTYFPSEIAVNKLRLGKMHLSFFVRDITLRRQAEEMLRTEHNAIQNAGNGIAVTNLDARLEYVNPAMVSMWGAERGEDMLGEDLRALFNDQAAMQEMMAVVLDGNHDWAGELLARKSNGETLEVQVSAACNVNSDGEAVGVVLSLTDISDRKRAESAMREAEQRRVMLESLGAACHHMGQPATILLANLGLIKEKLKTADGEVKQMLADSTAAVVKLGKVLHKLNEVNEYKTRPYLETNTSTDSEENRIIEI